MKKLRLIALLLIIFLFVSPKTEKVSALIPGGVEGTVYIKLPDKQREAAVGVKIYRIDQHSSFCPINASCWGDWAGVETTTDSNGYYIMNNEQNSPRPSCYTINDAGRAYLCPSGYQGQIDYSLSATGEIPECAKDANGVYYTPNLNWCGFNCGYSDHRWWAYFPQGYKLPGNLENEGYSITRGTWKIVNPDDPTVIIDETQYSGMVGNHVTFPNRNFIFFLDAPIPPTPTPIPTPTPTPTPTVTPVPSPTPTPTPLPSPTPTPTPLPSPTPTPQPIAQLQCVKLTGNLTDENGVSYTFANAPRDFKGTLNLTCLGQATELPITSVQFTVTNETTGATETKESTNINTVSDPACSVTYNCYSSAATFNINEIAKYSASAVVCNQETCK